MQLFLPFLLVIEICTTKEVGGAITHAAFLVVLSTGGSVRSGGGGGEEIKQVIWGGHPIFFYL